MKFHFEFGDRKMRFAFGVLLLMVWTSANAYLDPGTGSMMLQVILGGVAAVGVAVKLYWHKLRVAIGFGKKKESEEDSD
jgi:hypothetical protein